MSWFLMLIFYLFQGSLFLIEDFSQGIVFGFILLEFVDDLWTCADSDIFNKFYILFMKDVVLSLQLLDLIFIAQLSLHKNGLAFLFLIRNYSHFFLELSQHFLIILPLLRQLLTMTIIHILKYFLELINFEDCFIFF